MGEYALSHGGTTDVAMTDEKYFNHSFVSPCFAPEMPCFARISGYFVVVLFFALKCVNVANQSKVEQVVTTC